MDTSAEGRTARRSASPLDLIRKTAGTPAEMGAKIVRFARILAAYADTAELDARLARLEREKIIERAPSRIQMIVGSYDMLRFFISPAAAEYYESIGIDYAFHQVLRFLDEPASLADPVGFFSSRDGIIGHLMQVVHANPQYDLELLGMWDDGVEELERQIVSMMEGTHPRQASIGAIVEEPDYHRRLLEYVRAFRKNRSTPPPLRENLAQNERWREIDATFGSLRTAMRYFCKLPTAPLGAAKHALTVKEFPRELGELASA